MRWCKLCAASAKPAFSILAARRSWSSRIPHTCAFSTRTVPCPCWRSSQIEGWQNLICTRPEELALASNSFDAIVAGDILQSLPDDLIALRELRRVLKDGGSLCLTVPAYPSLWGEDDEARGHQRRYTASELRRKLNNCGFEISRVSYLVAIGISAFHP